MMRKCSTEPIDFRLVAAEDKEGGKLSGVADLDDMGVLYGNREGGLATGNIVLAPIQDGLCGKGEIVILQFIHCTGSA